MIYTTFSRLNDEKRFRRSRLVTSISRRSKDILGSSAQTNTKTCLDIVYRRFDSVRNLRRLVHFCLRPTAAVLLATCLVGTKPALSQDRRCPEYASMLSGSLHAADIDVEMLLASRCNIKAVITILSSVDRLTSSELRRLRDIDTGSRPWVLLASISRKTDIAPDFLTIVDLFILQTVSQELIVELYESGDVKRAEAYKDLFDILRLRVLQAVGGEEYKEYFSGLERDFSNVVGVRELACFVDHDDLVAELDLIKASPAYLACIERGGE